MKYENMKSGILAILVLVSIFFTWNLWTYQPNYDTMESSKTLDEVMLREKQDVERIIRPDRVMYHIKDEHYGTTKTDELDKIIKEISKWTFVEVKNYTGKLENFNAFAHAPGNAEIIFPGEVPIQLYRNVLKIEGKKIPSFNFDRIVINVENSGSENGIVYFISTETQQVFTSHISSANLSGFNRDFFKNATRLPRYFAYEASATRTIYLPEDETEMWTYKYLPVTLNSEEFKDALFRNPSFVQKSSISNGEEYTNDSSKMTVDYDTNMLSYVYPTAEDNYVENSYDLVKKSIDFVNEHGGWTDPYRYVAKNEFSRSVTFRLYTDDGYPVFNERGLSEIFEVWGRNELSIYTRPNIALELPLTTETQLVVRPSGHKALEFLQSKRNFKPELLEDLMLGYRIERDSDENRLIVLEPAWFYRYDHTWGQISIEDLGGLKHGLE